eukprot:CAMPEP_0194524880 /NCGR_PEP_ID=MMETSP0253-20130528/60184_1 /TAXON_ID=2966 /ORGANISM="Noctiluca scintillans" /LENGTH=66 /DNA_ID=CAMNT_0039369553 /DNA_START=914 /DNA_END=1114 /DNA_ORIENTATION=+
MGGALVADATSRSRSLTATCSACLGIMPGSVHDVSSKQIMVARRKSAAAAGNTQCILYTLGPQMQK